ncbi:MAG: gliding motility-associated C-terminal domain-containing protein, partial [Bacteroidales bacterium]
SGTNSITVTFGTTSGNVTVTETNAAGCGGAARMLYVSLLGCGLDADFVGSPRTLCAGSQVLFANTSLGTTSGTTFLWNFGEGANPATAATAGPHTVTYSTGGTKTVTLTITEGATNTETKTGYITVNPLPGATGTITGQASVCTGQTGVTYTVPAIANATSYSWNYSGSGATITGTTNSITMSFGASAQSGTLTVRGNNSCGTGTVSTGFLINVNPLPSAPTVGTITQPTCSVATGSVVLSGLPSTGSWTLTRLPGGATVTGTGTTFTVTGLPAVSHTFTVTNANECTSPASAAVVINNPPAVPTSPVIGTVTQPTCAVTTGSVGISGLPPTGTWTLTRNPGGAEVTGSGTTFTATGIPAGTYTYTVTNAAGCISPASSSFTVNASLPVPTSPDQTVDCTLGFNQAVLTVTSPIGTGYEYRLDAGGWQSSNSFSNVSNGTHTVTVRNLSGCTATGPEFSVNCDCVNPPLLTLGAAAGSTCGITAVTISGNTFGGSATSVTITENGGGTVIPASSTASPFSFSYNPTAADAARTVVITVTTNNPVGGLCTAASATYTLTVNALPVAPVRGTVTQPTCAVPTGSVVLNSLPASGNWTVTCTPGGQTTTGSGTSTTITGLAPGTYNFTVTNANGCVSAVSSNVVISAQPDTPPAPVIGTVTQPTCALSTGSVALSELPATGTWTLTRIPGNVSITGTGATRTLSAIPPGTYTFTVANATGCASPASAEVVINPQPVTPVAPLIGTITHPTCELATGNIVLEYLPEAGEWTLIRYPGATTSTGTSSSATISSLPAGTYNFVVRNADGCTSAVSANAVINTQPATPTAPVVGTITHPTFQVGTGSVVLSGLPSSGIWTLIRYPDGFTSQGTGTTRTVSGLEPGTYTFAVTNSLGCTSAATGNVVINARPGAPVVVINNPPNICSDQTADLTLPAVTAGSDANLTFTYWTDAAATVPLAAPATVPAGIYYIMGTSTAGYSTTRPVVVTADELPESDAGPDQVLDYEFGTTLNAEIPAIGTGVWALVSGTGEIFNSTAPSTQVNGLTIGDNVFSWTVTNGACYPVTDNVTVKVNNLVIPTLITPNLDGANDYFVLHGLQTLGRTELTIFDRRGLKVYENRDYDNLWDGVDYNSNPLPDDTYFYVVRAANGISLSGYIVVRR